MAAVITGDIIESSRLALAERQQQLNDLLELLFIALRELWPSEQQLRAESIQGDAFQIYLADENEALRAAILIKCFCLSQSKIGGMYRFDCRLSIGIGAVALLHPHSLAKSGGTVFDYSGRGLKEISYSGSQLVFKADSTAWSQAINMGLALADELLSRYTPAQSQAVFLKVAHPQYIQETLAELISIGRSAYSQRLKQAGWHAIATLFDYYAEAIKTQHDDAI